jgi:hypothetical protein
MWRLFQPQEMQRRAQQRDRSVFAAERIGDIKWQWRKVCEITGLGRVVYTPNGPAMSVPLIGNIVLGPPTTFTVKLQPGQLVSDVLEAAPRIAAAMDAHDIEVRALAAGWVLIELVPIPAFPQRAGSPEVVPFAARNRGPHGYADLAA